MLLRNGAVRVEIPFERVDCLQPLQDAQRYHGAPKPSNLAVCTIESVQCAPPVIASSSGT